MWILCVRILCWFEGKNNKNYKLHNRELGTNQSDVSVIKYSFYVRRLDDVYRWDIPIWLRWDISFWHILVGGNQILGVAFSFDIKSSSWKFLYQLMRINIYYKPNVYVFFLSFLNINIMFITIKH